MAFIFELLLPMLSFPRFHSKLFFCWLMELFKSLIQFPLSFPFFLFLLPPHFCLLLPGLIIIISSSLCLTETKHVYVTLLYLNSGTHWHLY